MVWSKAGLLIRQSQLYIKWMITFFFLGMCNTVSAEGDPALWPQLVERPWGSNLISGELVSLPEKSLLWGRSQIVKQQLWKRAERNIFWSYFTATHNYLFYFFQLWAPPPFPLCSALWTNCVPENKLYLVCIVTVLSSTLPTQNPLRACQHVVWGWDMAFYSWDTRGQNVKFQPQGPL